MALPYIIPVKIPFAIQDYMITLKDNYVIINRYVGIDTEIDIPENNLLKPVNIIGEKSFSSCTTGSPNAESIEIVYIPLSVEILEKDCFANCSNLKMVKAENIQYIGAYSFSGDSELEDISLGSNVTVIEMGAFGANSSLV